MKGAGNRWKLTTLKYGYDKRYNRWLFFYTKKYKDRPEFKGIFCEVYKVVYNNYYMVIVTYTDKRRPYFCAPTFKEVIEWIEKVTNCKAENLNK